MAHDDTGATAEPTASPAPGRAGRRAASAASSSTRPPAVRVPTRGRSRDRGGSSARSGRAGGAADRPGDGAVGRHRQRALAGARRAMAGDHQDPDGPRRDEDGDAVAVRRRGRADRHRAQARGDDQARRRGGARAGDLRGRRGGPRCAAAGRHDHGPRRPRQDDAARRDPRDVGRRDRGRRHHAAHRRVPGRPRRPAGSPSSTRPATRRSPPCAPAARR